MKLHLSEPVSSGSCTAISILISGPQSRQSPLISSMGPRSIIIATSRRSHAHSNNLSSCRHTNGGRNGTHAPLPPHIYYENQRILVRLRSNIWVPGVVITTADNQSDNIDVLHEVDGQNYRSRFRREDTRAITLPVSISSA